MGVGEHRPSARQRLQHDVSIFRRVRGRGAACPPHAGHGHRDDAAVPASVLRALAPLLPCHRKEAFPEASKELDQIRRIVAINLVLGLLTVTVGASGRFW
jgi:hypothetical protein